MKKMIVLISIVLLSQHAISQSHIFNWRAEVFSKPHLLSYYQKSGTNKANGTSYVAQDVILGFHYKFPLVVSETNVEFFNLNINTDTNTADKNLFLTTIEQSFSYKNFFASAQYDQLPLVNFTGTVANADRMEIVWANLGLRVLVSKKLRLKSKFYLGYPVSVNGPESIKDVSGLRAYGDLTWRKRIKRRWDFYINFFIDSKSINFKSDDFKTEFSLFRTGAGLGLSYLL